MKPKLTDIRAQARTFQPGDRVLVRSKTFFSRDQAKQMTKAVKKFAGCDVEVLILNCLALRVHHQTAVPGAVPEVICEPSFAEGVTETPSPGVAHISCSTIVFNPGDKLLITPLVPIDGPARRGLVAAIENWVREKDVEVSFIV